MGDKKNYGLSIFNRLLVSFLPLFILVSTALAITYYFFSRDSISRYANEAIVRESSYIDATFKHTIQDALPRELRLLSASPLLDEFLMTSANARGINARALERLFLQTVKYFDGIERIRFVDSFGMEQVIVVPEGRVKKYQSVQESKLFAKLESSSPGSINHSELVTNENGDHLFSIGIHKTDPDIGEFGGAIIIDYNFRLFFDFVRSVKIFGENPVWIFSNSDQALLRPSDQAFLDPRPFPDTVNLQAVSVYPHQGGIVAASKLAIDNNFPLLKVCISIPRDLLYQDVERVFRFLAIAFAVSCLIISVVVFFIAKYLSLPLRKLAGSAQKISQENFSEKIDVRATGEVAMLVDSFNSMARDLRKTTVSKDYVDSIFHAMTNSLIVLDSEGLIKTVNVATLSLLGYQEEELLGQPFSLILSDPFLVSEITKNVNINKIETQYLAKNGTEFPMLFSSSRMYTKQGGFQAVVCLALDLSDKKQVEQEKKLLEIQLRQAHKMEAIGTLAGGIAHDFNNILAAVIGYAELAELSNVEGKPAVEEIREVIKGGMRARDLVRQILAFSRKDQHAIEPLIPYPIVKEALKLLRATIPSSIEIKEQIDPGVGTISADPMKIHQVVMNLCTNAVQAMEDTGKGVITIVLTQAELAEKDLQGEEKAKPGQYVEITVHDTGKGIEKKIIERIFDPFFTTKDVGSGTGMGLAVVHGIVKEYGGLIRVKSDPASGTSFRVYLPVVDQEVAPAEGQDVDLVGGSERILIVDDEKNVLDIMKRRVEHLGYHVTAFDNVGEAARVFKENPDKFDLIITDQTMPDTLGTEMAVEIQKIRPNMPIILCSGFSQTVSEQTYKDFGIKIYLPKPVDFELLAKSIRNALTINR